MVGGIISSMENYIILMKQLAEELQARINHLAAGGRNVEVQLVQLSETASDLCLLANTARNKFSR